MPHAMNHIDDKIPGHTVSFSCQPPAGCRCRTPVQQFGAKLATNKCRQQGWQLVISRVDISSVWFAVAGILIIIILEDSCLRELYMGPEPGKHQPSESCIINQKEVKKSKYFRLKSSSKQLRLYSWESYNFVFTTFDNRFKEWTPQVETSF